MILPLDILLLYIIFHDSQYVLHAFPCSSSMVTLPVSSQKCLGFFCFFFSGRATISPLILHLFETQGFSDSVLSPNLVVSCEKTGSFTNSSKMLLQLNLSDILCLTLRSMWVEGRDIIRSSLTVFTRQYSFILLSVMRKKKIYCVF